MRLQITIDEVIAAATDALKASMYHCVPGIVHAYSASDQTADVQPAVHDVRFDPVLGTRISEPWPIVPKVPIAFPRFGGFTISGPVSPGDKVILLAFDLDPTAHRATGQPSDPIDVRRHGGVYWTAFPADLTDPGRLHDSSAAGAGLVLGKDGSTAQIRISGSGISLGAGASDAVALASKVDAFIHAVAGWSPNPGDGGAALKTALAAFTVAYKTGSALVSCG